MLSMSVNNQQGEYNSILHSLLRDLIINGKTRSQSYRFFGHICLSCIGTCQPMDSRSRQLPNSFGEGEPSEGERTIFLEIFHYMVTHVSKQLWVKVIMIDLQRVVFSSSLALWLLSLLLAPTSLPEHPFTNFPRRDESFWYHSWMDDGNC